MQHGLHRAMVIQVQDNEETSAEPSTWGFPFFPQAPKSKKKNERRYENKRIHMAGSHDQRTLYSWDRTPNGLNNEGLPIKRSVWGSVLVDDTPRTRNSATRLITLQLYQDNPTRYYSSTCSIMNQSRHQTSRQEHTKQQGGTERDTQNPSMPRLTQVWQERSKNCSCDQRCREWSQRSVSSTHPMMQDISFRGIGDGDVGAHRGGR